MPDARGEDEELDQILYRILISFGLPLNLATNIVAAAKVTPTLVSKLGSALSTLKAYVNSFYSLPVTCKNSVVTDNNSSVNTVSVGFALLLSLLSIVISFISGMLCMYLLIKFNKITVDRAIAQPLPIAEPRNRLNSVSRPVGGSQPLTSSPARNSGLAASMRHGGSWRS